MLTHALSQLIATAAQQHHNCLEIDSIVSRSFCGIPYLAVSSHARDLQPPPQPRP